MSTGNAEAILLNQNCTHEIRECPICRRKFLLSSYLGDPTLTQVNFSKRLRYDHENDPNNPQPHAEHIQL